MSFPIHIDTKSNTYTNAASGTVFNMDDLLPGGFVITNIRLVQPGLGANTNLAVRQEVLNAMGTGFDPPTDIIAATATSSPGTITGGLGSTNSAPRRISVITSGSGTANGTVTLYVEGFQDLR